MSVDLPSSTEPAVAMRPSSAGATAGGGEGDRGGLELLLADGLPDVELGPVGDREDAHVLALPDPPVVEVPQLRALVARLPLAEVVAEGEDAFLGPRAL